MIEGLYGTGRVAVGIPSQRTPRGTIGRGFVVTTGRVIAARWWNVLRESQSPLNGTLRPYQGIGVVRS